MNNNRVNSNDDNITTLRLTSPAVNVSDQHVDFRRISLLREVQHLFVRVAIGQQPAEAPVGAAAHRAAANTLEVVRRCDLKDANARADVHH